MEYMRTIYFGLILSFFIYINITARIFEEGFITVKKQRCSHLFLLAAIVFFGISINQTAFAQTFNVSSTQQLRQAFQYAASNGQSDEIILADGTYELSITRPTILSFSYYTGDPLIDNEITFVVDAVSSDGRTIAKYDIDFGHCV
jgi:hypothetical protein